MRDEKKFESLDALKIAISEDVSRVKSYFGHQ
ncbi:MAG: riboflavin kinase [Pseudomonadales bacterium]